jgi:hypothetical protein
MRRAFLAATAAALLLATLPGVAGAARVTKFTDHRVSFFCDGPVEDDGFLSVFVEASQAFGSFSEFGLWLPPALPFEDPPAATGFSESVDLTETASEVHAEVAYDATDGDGNPLGAAALAATLEMGDPETVSDLLLPGNHKSKTVRTFRPLEGSATLTLDGTAYELPCFGEVADETVWETNPTSSVVRAAGINIDCFWEFADGVARIGASDGELGFSTGAIVILDGTEYFDDGSGTGWLDETGVELEVTVQNDDGGVLTATASATFEPIGGR